MNFKIAIIFIISFLSSCKIHDKAIVKPNFSRITVDTLLSKKMSCRALLIDQNKVWYAGNNGNYGFVTLDKTIQEERNSDNTSKLEFRSIAQTTQYVFILSIANPALLYRIEKSNLQTKLVYQENNEKVFYDSMQFFNDNEGIAIGDPTDDCPSIIKTYDGGETWQKITCDKLPKLADGEAFFAASNTNLIAKGTTTWMVSGGKKARVFYSSNKGTTWKAYETPIVQGKTMTGIFTADFYDQKNGFIAGGDYENLEKNTQNKATTNDGGKKWQLVAENSGFGYASCVQYIPNSDAKSLVSVGATGVFYSNTSGETWIKLSEDKDFLTIRFINHNTAIAAGKNRIVRMIFK